MIKINRRLKLAITFTASLLSPALLAHQGHIEDEAVQACKHKQVSAACGYESATHKYIGSCQRIVENMICVRNQPLENLFGEISHNHQAKLNVESKNG